MKPVHPIAAYATRMSNDWAMRLTIQQDFLFRFKWEFLDSKAPLTDSQNRILDSKPMSLYDFQRFIFSLRNSVR